MYSYALTANLLHCSYFWNSLVNNNAVKKFFDWDTVYHAAEQ